jgi:hypothetical protein
MFIFLVTCSISAFAQFPLGSDINKIKSYFAENISYASVQEFKTENDIDAICFTKVKVVGDYTFYFDQNGLCSSYVVTYDRKELRDLIHRFDNKFCRLLATKWVAEDGTFDASVMLPKSGENFFSVVYRPLPPVAFKSNTLASN